ncbi:hypothetical protein U1Q18_013889 [Sarracenia purpurea var. burkii]
MLLVAGWQLSFGLQQLFLSLGLQLRLAAEHVAGFVLGFVACGCPLIWAKDEGGTVFARSSDSGFYAYRCWFLGG